MKIRTLLLCSLMLAFSQSTLADVYCPSTAVNGYQLKADKLLYRQDRDSYGNKSVWRLLGNISEAKTQAAFSMIMNSKASKKGLTISYPDGFDCNELNSDQAATGISNIKPDIDIANTMHLETDDNYWVAILLKSRTINNFELRTFDRRGCGYVRIVDITGHNQYPNYMHLDDPLFFSGDGYFDIGELFEPSMSGSRELKRNRRTKYNLTVQNMSYEDIEMTLEIDRCYYYF